MEGCQAEYRKDKSKVVVMLVASLEESYGYKDKEQSTTTSTMEPPNTTTPDTLDDVILTPDMVDLVSPTVVASNQNHHHFVYAKHEPSKPSTFTALNDFDHTTYLSVRATVSWT